jgi:atypical dual specificity phosphatase
MDDTSILALYRSISGQCLDDDTPTPSLIVDRLYLGNVRDAQQYQRLAELGVTHILSLAKSLRIPFPPSPFMYLAIDAQDSDAYPISDHFAETSAFIHAAIMSGGIVLVHCAAGVSRSATIVSAYCMSTHQMYGPIII